MFEAFNKKQQRVNKKKKNRNDSHEKYVDTSIVLQSPNCSRPHLFSLQSLHGISSARGGSPVTLTIVVCHQQVNQVVTRELPSSSSSEDPMVSSTRLGLTMRLDRQHFPGGTLTLGCQSTLPGIVGAKALERTETATLAASNQRLAQEPPRSGCVVNLPSSLLAAVCCFLLLRSFNYGIFTFSYV